MRVQPESRSTFRRSLRDGRTRPGRTPFLGDNFRTGYGLRSRPSGAGRSGTLCCCRNLARSKSWLVQPNNCTNLQKTRKPPEKSVTIWVAQVHSLCFRLQNRRRGGGVGGNIRQHCIAKLPEKLRSYNRASGDTRFGVRSSDPVPIPQTAKRVYEYSNVTKAMFANCALN